MRKLNLGELHVATLFTIHDLNGGDHRSPVIKMDKFSHASILIAIGVASRAAGVITVESCDDATPTTHTEIAFDYYTQETAFGSANHDVWSAKTAATTAGITPAAGTTGVNYLIELDAIQLTDGHIGFCVYIVNPAAASVLGGWAILSGAKFAGPQGVTQYAS